MKFILLGVAVQFGNFIWMRIGVTINEIQIGTFQIAAILLKPKRPGTDYQGREMENAHYLSCAIEQMDRRNGVQP